MSSTGPNDTAGGHAVDGDAIPIAVNAPPPVADEHSTPFWTGLAERRIVLQQCQRCERRRFPPMPTCPYCGAAGGDEVEIAGTGTVYSFIRAYRALTPAYADVAPYAVATIDLDGGGRMFGRVIPADACQIGVHVRPAFADHPGDVSTAWTELCFRPASTDE